MDDFTIRLDKLQGLISTDAGTSWTLSSEDKEHLRAVVARVCRSEPESLMPAGLHASLAEAASVAPGGGRSYVAKGEAEGRDAQDGLPLMPLVSDRSRPLADVLSSRKSERTLKPPSLGDLATLLVRVGRLRSIRETYDGRMEESRPLPSAGACHPIELELLVAGVDGLQDGHWQFDAGTCNLVQLGAPGPVASFRRELRKREIRVQGYAAVFAVAHFEKTLFRYPSGATLVWRDAGVVLA